MVGSSTHSAPRAVSFWTRFDAWARARVTTTRRPNRGRPSNQRRSRPATLPMTMVTGGSSVTSPSWPSVVRTVRCPGRVPHRTAATGGRRRQPSGLEAGGDLGPVGHAHEHDDRVGRPGQGVPVDVVVDGVAAVPGDHGERRGQRPVGHRDAGVGGDGDGRADARHHLERHPRRGQRLSLLAAPPEHEGVAALEPHHLLPRRPRSTSRALMSSWGTGDPGDLPTSIRSAPAGARSSREISASRSWTTTSARASSSAPRTVSRPGSPGPAPTR